MSIFDFPRIHFHGGAIINPATGNNNFFLPLVTYDPIESKALIPPRIYLNDKSLGKMKWFGVKIPKASKFVTKGTSKYFEINPINTQNKFQEWMKTPLGSSTEDSAYHKIYEIIDGQRTGKSLTGEIPGYWNYYGGMEFYFERVSIKSIQTLSEDGTVRTVTKKNDPSNAPLQDLLDSTIELGDKGQRAKPVMIDVLPSMSFYSQVFADRIFIKDGQDKLVSGKPTKGSLRDLNLQRVVNQSTVLAASGTFYSVMPLDEMETDSQIGSEFLEYLKKRHVNLRGLIWRYNLSEVIEDQSPDYAEIGSNPNPAHATVVGTIGPWLEEEPISFTSGRQLLPKNSFYEDKELCSFVTRIDLENNRFSMDLVGSIPVLKEEGSYETFNAGSFIVTSSLNDASVEIGRFNIDSDNYSKTDVIESGGIIDLPLSGLDQKSLNTLKDGRIQIYSSKEGAPVVTDLDRTNLIMEEADFQILSDQSGLYANQFDDPLKGYRSNSNEKEPCLIRIFQKGEPVINPIKIEIRQIEVTNAGSALSFSDFRESIDMVDWQEVKFPTDKPTNSLFVLFSPSSGSPDSDDLMKVLRVTGSFVNLRVLPNSGSSYRQYLDETHPDFKKEIPFELIHKEIFEVFELIYPMSSIITPFTEKFIKDNKHEFLKRMNPAGWLSQGYMPSTRDLSEIKWNLFQKWISQ